MDTHWSQAHLVHKLECPCTCSLAHALSHLHHHGFQNFLVRLRRMPVGNAAQTNFTALRRRFSLAPGPEENALVFLKKFMTSLTEMKNGKRYYFVRSVLNREIKNGNSNRRTSVVLLFRPSGNSFRSYIISLFKNRSHKIRTFSVFSESCRTFSFLPFL